MENRRDFFGKLSTAALLGSATAAAQTPTGAAESGFAKDVFNITALGARGDGVTLNTKAIQAALDTCTRSGGGWVFVPPGRFLTGTILLKSNVILYLAPGATILGSQNIADYANVREKCPYAEPLNYCLIYAEGVENVTVTGRGTIDGNARPGHFFKQLPGHHGLPERPMLLRFYDCRKVEVTDVFLTGAGSWCTHFSHTKQVKLDRVNIYNEIQDGFNIQSSEEFTISNCNLRCGDDGIALTTDGQQSPLKNFVITNCLISSRWAAVRLGPLSRGNYENILISNCVFRDCYGGGIKIGMFEGAEIRDVSVADIVMENVTAPIAIYLSSLPPIGLATRQLAPIGGIRNIRFSNIRAIATGTAGPPWYAQEMPGEGPDQSSCLFLHGSPGHRIENVTLSDIHVTVPGGGTQAEADRRDLPDFPDIPKDKTWPEHLAEWGPMPAYGLYARHVHGLSLHQVRFDATRPDARSAVFCNEVAGVELTACKLDTTGNLRTPVTLKNVHGALIQGCQSRGEAPAYVRVEGPRSRSIGLVANDLRTCAEAVQTQDGAMRSEVAGQANLLKLR